jgi:hypothetical protein
VSGKVEVATLPKCDMHEMTGAAAAEAHYDGKTKFGPWAFMCEDCFAAYGIGLGTGRGQKLVVRET